MASDARLSEKQPCSGCGYMVRGGSMCGDCREYGPPRGWRWEYDAATGKHKQVGSYRDGARMSAGDATRCDHCDDTKVVLEPSRTPEEPSREIHCGNCAVDDGRDRSDYEAFGG